MPYLIYRGCEIRPFVIEKEDGTKSYGAKIIYDTYTDRYSSRGEAVGEALDKVDELKMLLDCRRSLNEIKEILEEKQLEMSLDDLLWKLKYDLKFEDRIVIDLSRYKPQEEDDSTS